MKKTKTAISKEELFKMHGEVMENGLQLAYDMGHAAALEEAPEKTFRNAYKKGRSDAIDEYNAKIKDCCKIVGSCDFDDLDLIAEQLKEQK